MRIFKEKMIFAFTVLFLSGMITFMIGSRDNFMLLVGLFMMILSVIFLGSVMIAITIAESIWGYLKGGNNE